MRVSSLNPAIMSACGILRPSGQRDPLRRLSVRSRGADSHNRIGVDRHGRRRSVFRSAVRDVHARAAFAGGPGVVGRGGLWRLSAVTARGRAHYQTASWTGIREPASSAHAGGKNGSGPPSSYSSVRSWNRSSSPARVRRRSLGLYTFPSKSVPADRLTRLGRRPARRPSVDPRRAG
jgi:hypothetical protein